LRADKDEVKFVIANRDDWDFARDIIKRFELEKRALAILISPVWNNLDLQVVAGWITSSHLKVRMQLQMHKYIWGPEARGV
jgi:7-carboxy-7-deazaguanine synthase